MPDPNELPDPNDLVIHLRTAALSGDLALGASFGCAQVADVLARVTHERDMYRAACNAYDSGLFDTAQSFIDQLKSDLRRM